MKTIDELIAAELDAGDELVTNAERGAAVVKVHTLTQELIASGAVFSPDRYPLRLTPPGSLN